MTLSPPSGCTYGGQDHAEGSSWFAGSTPCISCMCVDGVTTCSEIRCLSPCINFINMPGECCPVCAGKHMLTTFCQLYLQKSRSDVCFIPQTVCLRAECLVQVTVSTRPETHVRSVLVRFVTCLHLEAEKTEFIHTDENQFM